MTITPASRSSPQLECDAGRHGQMASRASLPNSPALLLLETGRILDGSEPTSVLCSGLNAAGYRASDSTIFESEQASDSASARSCSFGQKAVRESVASRQS